MAPVVRLMGQGPWAPDDLAAEVERSFRSGQR